MLFFSISKSTVPHCKVFLRSIWFQLQLLRNLRTTFVLLSVFPRKSPFFQNISSFFLFFFVLSHNLLHTYPLYKIVSYIDLSRTSKLWTVYNLCSTLNSGIYILPTSSIGFEFNKIYFGLGKQVGRLLYYEMWSWRKFVKGSSGAFEEWYTTYKYKYMGELQHQSN